MGSLMVRAPKSQCKELKKIEPPHSADKAELKAWLRHEGLLLGFGNIDFSEATLEIIDRFHESFFYKYADKQQLKAMLQVYEQHTGELNPKQLERHRIIKDNAMMHGLASETSRSPRSTGALTVSAPEDQASLVDSPRKQLCSPAILIPDSPLRLSREVYRSSEETGLTDSSEESEDGNDTLVSQSGFQ